MSNTQTSSRKVPGPVVLVVLDGWGLREETANNGVALAKTPWYDHLASTYPFTTLHASGEAVGLPEGQMGNSEVGHTTIGAGCVLYQDLVKLSKEAKSGNFTNNIAFTQAFEHVKKRNSQLHILGMLSAGGVHSHEDHLIESINAALAAGIKRIVVHPFLDGRDSPKTAGVQSLRKLEKFLSEHPECDIGSISGRYYSMDRDTNWDRTTRAFQAIFDGHMEPMVFSHDGKPHEVLDGDALIFTNFRKDRAKQLSQKICENVKERDLFFVTMTDYGREIEAAVAYTPEVIKETLGGLISKAGLKQARVAETEKFPHATYFMNGGQQDPYEGEEDVLIPSRKDIKTHDQAPEMRAKEICDETIKRLGEKDFIFVNFANPDMVGHTANEKAVVTAIETVDRELKRLTDAVLEKDGAVLVIADHGNAEVIIDPHTGDPHTSHTTNPVPCILVSDRLNHGSTKLRKNEPGLQDVAPTVLDLLGLPKAESMTGESVIA